MQHLTLYLIIIPYLILVKRYNIFVSDPQAGSIKFEFGLLLGSAPYSYLASVFNGIVQQFYRPIVVDHGITEQVRFRYKSNFLGNISISLKTIAYHIGIVLYPTFFL